MWRPPPVKDPPGVTSGPGLSDGENHRKDFGLLERLDEAGGVVVGDEVSITFEAELVQRFPRGRKVISATLRHLHAKHRRMGFCHSADTIQDCVQS